jgi:pimeloyl-ACP methyl ester carboxylesterase
MVSFPTVEINAGRNLPKIVFIAGFPDNETSCWGHVLPDRLAQEYHLIMLCFPGYEDGGKIRPWGYDFPKLIEGMHGTIAPLLSPNEKFVLIAHDWGSTLSFSYLEKYGSFVSKFVALDVGITKLVNLSWPTFIRFAIYQLWFAWSFVLSQYLGRTIGTLFMIIIMLPGFRNILPTKPEKLHRPSSMINANFCYPHYYLWKGILMKTRKPTEFPSNIPTLFMVRLLIECFSNFTHSK